ncbi:hypothetical protein GGI12_000900 [Dipsacomyces acuminosporus]|nr:hypothetical protein GGI12_000900 [Dipsacomyces acuminosporus]
MQDQTNVAAKSTGFLADPQLAFFPTVPQQLRDGYLEFKATYYRKRDAAKRRLQERMRREKQRKNSASMASFKTNERRPKRRHLHQTGTGNSSSGSASYLPANLGSASGSPVPFVAGTESATDDGGSTTSSSVVSHRLGGSSVGSGRPGSKLMYTLPEQLSNSESEAHDDSISSFAGKR